MADTGGWTEPDRLDSVKWAKGESVDSPRPPRGALHAHKPWWACCCRVEGISLHEPHEHGCCAGKIYGVTPTTGPQDDDQDRFDQPTPEPEQGSPNYWPTTTYTTWPSTKAKLAAQREEPTPEPISTRPRRAWQAVERPQAVVIPRTGMWAVDWDDEGVRLTWLGEEEPPPGLKWRGTELVDEDMRPYSDDDA